MPDVTDRGDSLQGDYELRGNKMMIGGIELQEQPGTAKTV